MVVLADPAERSWLLAPALRVRRPDAGAAICLASGADPPSSTAARLPADGAAAGPVRFGAAQGAGHRDAWPSKLPYRSTHGFVGGNPCFMTASQEVRARRL